MNRLTAGAIALVAAAGLVVSACTDDDADDQVVTAPSTTAGSEPGGSVTTTSSTEAPAEAQPALWPAAGVVVGDPVEAATGFVTEVAGGETPTLGEFREGEPGAGEIEVLRSGEGGGATGVRSVLSLRRLGEGWFVTSAQSGAVTIESPEPLALVAGTIEVTGAGRGFEGTLLLSLHVAGESAPPLAETFVTAGASEQLEPFATELDASGAPPGATLALVVGNENAADGGLGEFSAVPLVAAP